MNFDLWRTLDVLPGIVIGLTVHEAAHAWVAFKLGDSTAQEQGRITLNPLSHIDILGLCFIIFAGFGWAKPVQFRDSELRNPSRDPIYIALAGPISNAITAFILTALYVFLLPSLHSVGSLGNSISKMLYLAIFTNWGLFLFNLIPIPPLDGSHVLFWWIRDTHPATYQAIYKYGTWLLVGLLVIASRLETGVPFLSEGVRYFSALCFGIFGKSSL